MKYHITIKTTRLYTVAIDAASQQDANAQAAQIDENTPLAEYDMVDHEVTVRLAPGQQTEEASRNAGGGTGASA